MGLTDLSKCIDNNDDIRREYEDLQRYIQAESSNERTVFKRFFRVRMKLF